MACASSGAGALACFALAAAAAAMPSAGRAADAVPRPAVLIELRPQVKATQAQVRLGDIAFLTSNDLSMLRRLMAVPIGAAPRPGTPVLLDRDVIARWVEARSGLQIAQAQPGAPTLRWGGAGETQIESEAQELSGELVVDAARSALMNWLSQCSVRAEVQPVSSARDLVLPAGTPTLRVRPLSGQVRPAKRMLVWVDAWVDDRFVRTTAISFEVGAWAPVTVATSALGPGASLDPVLLRGATESREVDLTAVTRGMPLSAGSDAVRAVGTPQRLRRPLRSGEVLTEAHLEAMPAVTRGNWAHLLARSGDVSVESRVEVLQDGKQGQMVRVKVPGAGGEVLALVTGPGQVEVQP